MWSSPDLKNGFLWSSRKNSAVILGHQNDMDISLSIIVGTHPVPISMPSIFHPTGLQVVS
jgi:hypothetical protein